MATNVSGVSTTELVQTKLGKAFVEAKERAERLNQHYKENEIGEQEIVSWNPYKLRQKNPYAEIIADTFDEMIKTTIPEDAVISTRFQNWITREKNELMVDSKINKDAYFKEQINFETGEVIENRANAIIKEKIKYLNEQLSILQKSFITHMKKNPEIAFASKEQLEKWNEYYNKQAEKVNQILESGDYSYYDKKDKSGNVIESGTQKHAQEHFINIENASSKINEALERQAERAKNKDVQAEHNHQTDYVGESLENSQRNIRKNTM